MVDVDGVLIVNSNPKGWSANLERDLGISQDALQAEFFAPHWPDIILGRADLYSRLVPVLKKIGRGVRAQDLVQYWFEHDSHINHDLLKQLIALRATGLELHLATVQEHERARYLWQTLGFEHHFAAIHYAAALGAAKPAQAFFEAIELRTGFEPFDLFFIDDSPRNVEAAIARGWCATVWDGQTSLIDLMSAHSP